MCTFLIPFNHFKEVSVDLRLPRWKLVPIARNTVFAHRRTFPNLGNQTGMDTAPLLLPTQAIYWPPYRPGKVLHEFIDFSRIFLFPRFSIFPRKKLFCSRIVGAVFPHKPNPLILKKRPPSLLTWEISVSVGSFGTDEV